MTKQQEYKEKGDDYMATKLVSFLSEEDRIAAEARGMDIMLKIASMLKKGIPASEIADECKVSPNRVEQLRLVL